MITARSIVGPIDHIEVGSNQNHQAECDPIPGESGKVVVADIA
jgi:hypothetical protein